MLKSILTYNSEFLKNLGLAVIRIGLGIIFIRHGWPKLFKGVEEWRWLGEQMSYLGITFWPVFWGLVAACTEFFGGIALVVGLGTRPFALLLAFVMLIATLMHIGKGDTWGYISFPLSLFVVFVGLMIAGGGMLAVDNWLK
ncbi:MAG TPA: DoxX family protein [Candidatus Babeliales bacterium]|nr:DoxX family protein [Candidatus Babeliales bacterium]